jgi:hypothetical protein
MEQMVDFPTQVKGNILDLIVTNIPERFEDVSEHGRLGKSDHFMIVAKISGGVARQEENGAPDWRKADWDAMRTALRDGNWMRCLRGKGTEEAWNILKETVTEEIKTGQHGSPKRS